MLDIIQSFVDGFRQTDTESNDNQNLSRLGGESSSHLLIEEPDQQVKQEVARDDKSIRENLEEHQIDKMVKDSFPASDPPSTY